MDLIEKYRHCFDRQGRAKQERPLFSIGELARYALSMGPEGRELAQEVATFSEFPSLWCKESDYSVDTISQSLDLVWKAFDSSTNIHSLPCWAPFEEKESSSAFLLKGENFSLALANQGEGIPLGVIRGEGLFIPSFGPHSGSLSDTSGFGIRGASDRLWWSVAALPETWFSFQVDLEKKCFDCKFVGFESKNDLFFSFYIHADSVRIDKKNFLPKSLSRYIGPLEEVEMEKEGKIWRIEARGWKQMQLIPLVGKGAFWESQFLLSYQVPSTDLRCQILFVAG